MESKTETRERIYSTSLGDLKITENVRTHFEPVLGQPVRQIREAISIEAVGGWMTEAQLAELGDWIDGEGPLPAWVDGPKNTT